MNITDFADDEVLARAAQIHAQRKTDERIGGFKEQDTVTIRWNLPTVKGGRKYLGNQGYDGVEVDSALVAEIVLQALKGWPSP